MSSSCLVLFLVYHILGWKISLYLDMQQYSTLYHAAENRQNSRLTPACLLSYLHLYFSNNQCVTAPSFYGASPFLSASLFLRAAPIMLYSSYNNTSSCGCIVIHCVKGGNISETLEPIILRLEIFQQFSSPEYWKCSSDKSSF